MNILAPHLGIKLPLFWLSTFLGIFAVSVIHTTIGEKLDEMTSPADFRLFTFRNALLLGGVSVAVLVPVVLKRRSGAEPLEEATPGAGRVRLEGEEGPLRSGSRSLMGRRRLDDDADDGDDDELPPVRMRGAIAGFSSRSSKRGGADQEALLEDDADSDGRPGSRGSMDGADTDEESLPGFDDRREQGPRRTRPASGTYSHSSRGPSGTFGSTKAGRVLGLAGPGNVNPRSHSHAHANGGASITDSLSGLWSKVTGRE